MTATSVYKQSHAAPAARRARAHGIDRLVMRLSLVMMLWARQRADRGFITREQHTLRRENTLVIEREQRAAALRIVRAF
ncbi:MAG: hypothetical protein ABJA94_03080 [Rhodoglobus sp.]